MSVSPDLERIARLRRALRRDGFDALILRLPEHIVMCCGAWPMNGRSWAVVTAEAGPVALVAPSCEDQEMRDCWCPEVAWYRWPMLDMPDPEQAVGDHLRRILRAQGLTRARLGFENGAACIAPPHNAGEVLTPDPVSVAWLQSLAPRARWRDATSTLVDLRARKTVAEIDRLRLANRVAQLGHRAFSQATLPGTSEAAIAAEVYRACLIGGVRLPGVRHINVYPQLSSGRDTHRAWRPVVSTGRRCLRDGDVAVLELAVCVDGFWSDTTRVAFAGKPQAVLRDAYAAVRAAQAAAIAAIAPGVRAEVPDAAATAVLRLAGFADHIIHLTGHGLGFAYHEATPLLMPGNRHRLRQGEVMSVEPGLYCSDWGGIRCEDNISVTVHGACNLTMSCTMDAKRMLTER